MVRRLHYGRWRAFGLLEVHSNVNTSRSFNFVVMISFWVFSHESVVHDRSLKMMFSKSFSILLGLYLLSLTHCQSGKSAEFRTRVDAHYFGSVFPQELLVLTVATEPTEGFQRLTRSLDTYGIKHEVWFMITFYHESSLIPVPSPPCRIVYPMVLIA